LRSSLLVLLFASRATAFEDPTQFLAQDQPHAATFGASGEGVYFTGAPRFSSLTCASCHTDGPGQIKIKLGADQPDLFTNGYVPSQTYLFEVELFGETKGLEYSGPGCTEPPTKNDKFTYQQCNSNGFALEIDSVDGPLTSGFCGQAPVNGMCPGVTGGEEVMIAPQGDAVFAQRQHSAAQPYLVLRNDPTSWHVWWTAPPAGSGALTIYVAAVDGNGGSGTADNDQDPFGDDTIQASFSLREQGAPNPPATTAGCNLNSGAHFDASWILVLALLFVRRKNQRA
jgi:hypothetical protein